MTPYQEMITELKSKMNKAVVKIDTFSDRGIVFHFINGYKIIISPAKAKSNHLHSDGVSLIYDYDFNNLSHIVFGQPIKLDHENGSKFIYNIVNTFKSEDFFNKEKQLENYKSINIYELKSLLAKYLLLPVNPDKEYFLYGDDELRPRFKQSPKLKFKAQGHKVIISDTSALLFDDGKRRYIDLESGLLYKKDGLLYLDRNIVVMKEFSEAEVKSGDDSYLVSFDQKGNKKFFKNVLKEGVDLSKIPTIKYQEVNGFFYKLKKNKNVYFFEDEQGKISISHPDLLIVFQD